MNSKSEAIFNSQSTFGKVISWLFGTLFFLIGIVNTFWGNDPGFGVFILFLSFFYFLPMAAILKKITGLSIPGIPILKILVGVFILWASLGVGELFNKIQLMSLEFQ